MFLLLAILATVPSAPPPPPKVERRARAAVHIVQGQAISAQGWRPAGDPAQREKIQAEPDGTRTRLRLTEFQ
jgi:hypothetical protein